MSQISGVSIERTGLVTSVGNNAPASCAAMRSKLTNPSETRFTNLHGEWILAHQVQFATPLRRLRRLARMAAMAINECLEPIPASEWPTVPLILCLAERSRPNRHEKLDQLAGAIERELQARFSPTSIVIAQGRVSVAVALRQAQRMILGGEAAQVVIAAVDSLLDFRVLGAYEEDMRLLTAENSNGLMVGEAAGALLLTGRTDRQALRLMGTGFAREIAHVLSDAPLRADGLAAAIREALREADMSFLDLDFRITDLSGEHYYFKEAALAVGRILHSLKDEFDLWHPAESVGETGAAAGAVMIALADAACRQGFAPGDRILIHMSADAGERAAAVLQFGVDQ